MVTYDQVQSKIFEQSCLACHASREPKLNSYEQVVAALSKIEVAVLRDKTMPKRGPLSVEDQALLQAWIDGGALPTPTGTETPKPPVKETPISRPVRFDVVKKLVFSKNCIACHSTGNADALTDLETYESVKGVSDFILPLVTGRSGDTVIDVDQRMPPPGAKPLTPEQVALLQMWFEDGLQDAPVSPVVDQN